MNDAIAKRFGAYCAIMGVDVGAALVRNGWARPRPDAYAAEVAEARRNRAGLWNGDWTIEPSRKPALAPEQAPTHLEPKIAAAVLVQMPKTPASFHAAGCGATTPG